LKCYLHIGTEKTATTTLQSFFHLNRSILCKQGVLYTQSAGLENNIDLCLAAYNINRRDEFTSQRNINNDNELLSFQEFTIKKLKYEISNFDSNIIVFSSEHFHSRLTTLDEIKRLRKILNVDLGLEDIKVIVYLRDPVDLACSLYSTEIMAGSTANPPMPHESQAYFHLCNHENTLKNFSNVFGNQSIYPKLFDNTFKNFSIIDDFLNTINVNKQKNFKIPPNKNERLSATGIALLKKVNDIVPVYDGDQINPIRENIMEYVCTFFSDKKYIFPKELCQQYEVAFQDSNEWVRSNYFSDKDILFARKEREENEEIRICEADLVRVSKLIARIWIDKQNHIFSLIESNSNKSKELVINDIDDGFNYNFYISCYNDIANFSYENALIHWQQHGKEEGRFSNENDFYKDNKIDINELPTDFDPKKYIDLNKDLTGFNIYDAIRHYLLWGKYEGRSYKKNA